MTATNCTICGGRRFLDEHGAPSCEACQTLLAAHVVSMRTDRNTGDALAVCPCGWSSARPWTKEGRLQCNADVVDHWRSLLPVTP